MDTLTDLYFFIADVCDKDGRGYISPKECAAWITAGQNKLYEDAVEDWQNPDTGAHGFGGSRRSNAALKPFRKRSPYTGEVMPYPADYGREPLLFKVTANVLSSIPIVIAAALEPHLSNPLRCGGDRRVATEDAEGFTIHPKASMELELHYLAKPKSVKIGFAEVAGNLVINDTDAGTTMGGISIPASVLPQFDTQYWVQLAHKALQYAGLNLGDEMVAAMATRFTQEDGK